MATSTGIVVLVIILLLLLLATILSVFNDTANYLYATFGFFLKRNQPLAAKHRNILCKYSSYYNFLPVKDQQKFQQRIQRFMYSKQFIMRGSGEVTDVMRVLISACAVQLTFGLPKVYLSHFHKILIYPDSYYSQITRKYHIGEVNPRLGMIILSWKNFLEGFGSGNLTLNLGIHEMAHAIHLENRIRNDEFNFLDADCLQQMEEIMACEVPKIRNGEKHFFRSYAGTNEYEFFAVALEYFFGRPEEFSKALPELYKVLTRLLNQDPMELYGVCS